MNHMSTTNKEKRIQKKKIHAQIENKEAIGWAYLWFGDYVRGQFNDGKITFANRFL